ncbi:ferric reductase-like transmembrane domain-containing protein [Salinibacterium sp. SWN139]|uniref:ferredoxin reductase family protein n=1 Tax=Salinibacterium sp. SWN139 TaxID=2792055 RepID=UPI0018CF2D2B|nr:ferredoxin reductase family protein [Salinibacterium sp. SWN139]MBH0055092.1 ferric reductase-like transmembrane domain-containing protein [Salinibacterium sp. SWN139]
MSTQVRPRAATARPRTALAAVATAPDYRRNFARRARLSDLLVVALWASGAAAAALFLASGGVDQFTSVAETVTSIGIVSGLVGTDFILVMLVLAARIPLIDRTIGHDRAIAVHRSLGKPALYLLLAHGALLLTGYGLSSGINPIAEIGPMLSLPDMPLAFIALGLMIAVVVSSLIAVRRRFSYEGWHLVHLLSYVSVAFALPHQLSVGGVLADGTLQRVYWIALYVVALGSIVTFRFAEPLVSSLRHRMRVAAVTEIAPGVSTIQLAGNDLRGLGASGGQFFIWRFWTPRTWWHSHPISLSAMPTASSARITVRNLGTGSAQLTTIPVGTRVSIEGPYGLFSDAARTSPKLAIIAAGIGVTPVRALLEQASFAPGEATILLRASTAEETYHWDEIRAIAAAKGATCYSMIGHRPRGIDSWMTAADYERGVTLQSAFPELADSDVFLCGPTTWLDLIEADVHASGIRPQQIHAERFDW